MPLRKGNIGLKSQGLGIKVGAAIMSEIRKETR